MSEVGVNFREENSVRLGTYMRCIYLGYGLTCTK